MRKTLGLLTLAFAIGYQTSYAALNGNYTINPSAAASATNYLTFGSAVSDMVSGTRADGGPVNGSGVSGAVTFNVAAATFTEKISIPGIMGASAANTITFLGASATTSIITFNSTTINDYTIQLNGADFIRLVNLGIANTGTTYGYGVQLVANADNNIISSCNISLPPTSTSNYHAGIIAATYFSTQGTNFNNLQILNNTINGGQYGFVANGSASVLAPGLQFTGNIITNANSSSLYLQYLTGANINRNVITPRAGSASSYGSQMRYCNGFTYNANQISSPGAYGAYFLGNNAGATSTAVISNNMIGGGFQTSSSGYGIYLSSCAYTRVIHNSVLVDNPGTNEYAFYSVSSTPALEVLNNAFSAANTANTTGFAAYITPLTGLTVMNNNMYHTPGSNSFVFVGAAYTSLPALQAALPAFNQNSQAGNPNFVSASNLHTFGPALANWASPSTITTDFDTQTRPMLPDPTPDVGADEFILTPIDPDIIAIVSPTVAVIGNNNVSVRVQNNGSSNLNGLNLTMEYSTDGGTTWPVTQVFVPTTLATSGSQEVFTFSTPWNVAASGSFNLCVRINPNMAGDPDPVTPTCINVCTGLGGAYTLNPLLPTGGTNFNNFNDAIAALTSCGVGAPTTINIAPGTYTGGFVLGNIPGVSAVNRVVFDGGSATLVTINSNSSTLNNSIIKMDGADYVTWRNITTEVLGIYGYCFHLTNGADHNIIENNRLLMSQNTTSVYQIGVLAAGNSYTTNGNHANNTIVRNNYIRGGYYGTRFNGTSTTTYSTKNTFERNDIEDFYYYGVYLTYQNAPVVDSNQIDFRTTGITASFGYNVYIFHGDSSFSVSGNAMSKIGAYGIYISNGNRNNTGRGRIANNMVGGLFNSTSTCYALYMTASRDVEIFHNSFHLGGASGYAAYLIGSPPTSDSLRLVNNIFSAATVLGGASGVALRISSSASVVQMSHNLFHGGIGSTLVDINNIQFSTMTAFQATFPGLTVGSQAGNPGFRSDADLHIVCSFFDNLGTPIPSITTDLDEQPRSPSAPDWGADEYTPTNVTTSLGPDFSNCGPLYVYADTTNFQYFYWMGTASLPVQWVDSTGDYFIEVIDSNYCRARDTVHITVLSYPTLVYEGDTIGQCAYDSLNVGNAGNDILWSTGDTTAVIYPSQPGLYTAQITTPDGCSSTDSVTVILFADAVANLGNDSTFCNGGSYTLNAGSGPTGTTYTWNNGSTTQVLVVSASGTYAVTVSTPQGCTANDSVTLNVLQPPVVNLGPNRFECDQFTLDAGTGGASYLWSNSANTQTISSTASGTYSVTVVSANGCVSTDLVVITVAPTPTVNLGADQIVCDGSTATFSAGNPGMTYLWSTGATSQSITAGLPGTYVVSVTDPGSGCTGTDEVDIIQSNLNVFIGPDFSLCIGDQGVLDAGSGASGYLWNTGDLSQTITVSQAGAYSVQVTDANGCVAEDTILVTVQSRPTVAFSGPAAVPLLQPASFSDGSSAAINAWFWDFGDGQTSTAQNPTHIYQAMGTFTVCLTASNGACDSTVCQTIVVGPPVEVEDELLSAYTTVYPNPSAGAFRVAFDLPAGLDLNLEVYDVAGQRLLSRVLTGVRTRTEDLDLTSLADGAYFMRVTSTKGHLLVTKLVKQ